MSRPVVLVTWGSFYTDEWLRDHWSRLMERCELRLTDRNGGPEWLAEVAEADAIIARRADVNREALEAGTRLRGVVTAGG